MDGVSRRRAEASEAKRSADGGGLKSSAEWRTGVAWWT